MNLPELIDKSEKSKLAKLILDEAVKNAFGDRKPLTELLDKLEETHTKLRSQNDTF